MPLATGTRIGAFEIIGAIGAGGMGEVYRARDTRLNRDVAIKVLSDLLAGDEDRLTRFRREAHVLASLNHPNIGHIYGLEETSPAGHVALVLELVEGPTLADRIRLGPIPIADALPIARQIAEAVEAAHEQGIIHRDLKPANIKLKSDRLDTSASALDVSDCAVKVLDFGLAKALGPDGASSADVQNSPTLTARATQMGMILGTAAYMAPEQARGKAVDRRADVWAFGVVLYEMLTGRRAFDGDEMSDVLASVLKETPALDRLPADTPSSIRRLLRRCLEKDRRERLGDMSAVRLEIKEAAAGDPSAAPELPRTMPPRRRIAPGAIAAGIALVLGAGAIGWWLKPSASAAGIPISRYGVQLPANITWSRPGRRSIAISPDGTHVAYIADNKLFIRKLDQFEATAVAGVTDPVDVFFSSDSAFVGFHADGRIQKVALTGGAPIPVCPMTLPFGTSWSGDMIFFGNEKGIHRVPASGGTPELIVTHDGSEALISPQLLPGGEKILYTKGLNGAWNDAEVVVEDLRTHARTVVMRGGNDARYLEDGYLVYGRSGEILAVSMDLATLRLTSTPVSLVSGVLNNTGTVGAVQFSVSATGTLVYASGVALQSVQMVWANLEGGQQPIVPERGAYQYVRVSPDGTRIAFNETVGTNTDVYVLDARGSKTRLTTDPGVELAPVWSPDSRRIAYSSDKAGGTANLYVRNADRSGVEERLTTSPVAQFAFSWSKDSDTLFFVEQHPQTGNDIWALPLKDKKPQPLVVTPFDERRPAVSPNGRWLAYGSNELGTSEIHVQPYPDINREKHQVSAGGGTSPLWSTDGNAIFYRQGPKIFRVSVTTTPVFKAGKPQDVRAAPPDTGAMSYSLDSSGKRFAIIQSNESGLVSEYRVVLNWIEDLKARVRPKR